MKSILKMTLGVGFGLGLAGSIILLVYLVAPSLIEQNLELIAKQKNAELELKYELEEKRLINEYELKEKQQNAELELQYRKKIAELDRQIEEQKQRSNAPCTSE